MLADSRGDTETLQILQHKKLETQLITEIPVWLNILFLHIPCTAKSLPFALSSFSSVSLRKYFLLPKSISTEVDLRTLKPLMFAITISLDSYSVKHMLSGMIHLQESACPG